MIIILIKGGLFFILMGIVEGFLSREDEIIAKEGLAEKSMDYLEGYFESYRENRNSVRRFLEDLRLIRKPLIIRAYEKAIWQRYEEMRRRGGPELRDYLRRKS